MRLHNLLIATLLLITTSAWAQPSVECWDRFELAFTHATAGNPFDVELSATFTNGRVQMAPTLVRKRAQNIKSRSSICGR